MIVSFPEKTGAAAVAAGGVATSVLCGESFWTLRDWVWRDRCFAAVELEVEVVRWFSFFSSCFWLGFRPFLAFVYRTSGLTCREILDCMPSTKPCEAAWQHRQAFQVAARQ